jgi:hypothetical protein
VSLLDPENETERTVAQLKGNQVKKLLMGSLVSSCHYLRDLNNEKVDAAVTCLLLGLILHISRSICADRRFIQVKSFHN